MKKIILFAFLVFALVACGNNSNNNDSSAVGNSIIDNSYISEGNIEVEQSKEIPVSVVNEVLSDKKGFTNGNGFLKNGYSVLYKIKGQEEKSQQNVYTYRKDGNLVYFRFVKLFDNVSKHTNCDIAVRENELSSLECGDKEGEVVNKILKAIENKTYFDY